MLLWIITYEYIKKRKLFIGASLLLIHYIFATINVSLSVEVIIVVIEVIVIIVEIIIIIIIVTVRR